MSDGMDNNSQGLGNRVMNYNLATPLNAMNKAGAGWIIIAISLYFLDWFFLGFDGINFKRFLNEIGNDGTTLLITILTNGVVWIILGIYYFFFEHENKTEIGQFTFAVIVTTAIISFVSFDFASILHIVLAWCMAYFLFQKAGIPKGNSYMYVAGLLFVDFFLFSMVASYGDLIWFNRLIVPIHFLIAVAYTKDGTLKNILIFLVAVFYILQVASTAIDYRDVTAKLNQGQKVTAKNTVARAWNNLKAIYNGTATSIKQEINDTKKDLGGTTYVTEVDANSKRDLGVNLEKVEASATAYLEGERIIVYGNLKGRSMDDDTKVKVFISCDAKNGWYDNQKLNGTIDGNNIYEINMGLYEEKFFTCEINNATKGSWTISINAYFNFTTQGYLKTYFIDKDRYLSLRGKDIDVFDVFGITEKTPISKSVNGPGKIGIATVEPPTLITSSSDEIFNSYVGISLVNNWPGGRITRVNDIHITIPEGLSIKNCEDRFENNPSREAYTDELTYSLTKDYIKKLQSRKTIDTISEKCSLKLDSASRVLEEAPFTTKYFKAEVDYEYLLKKSVEVMINTNPELEAARRTESLSTFTTKYNETKSKHSELLIKINEKKTKFPDYPTEYSDITLKSGSILQKYTELGFIISKKNSMTTQDMTKGNLLVSQIDKLFTEIDFVLDKIEATEATKTADTQTETDTTTEPETTPEEDLPQGA